MIIPAINCQEFAEVKERFRVAQEILFGAGEKKSWIHIDIADGGFTNGYSTWRSAQEFTTLARNPNLKIEVHVMINEPETVIREWLAAGMHRIIFHFEATAQIEALIAMCKKAGVEPMLALKPETSVAQAASYLEMVSGCQVLAVAPGLANQAMSVGTLEKIQELRKAHPGLLIEVDGGITPETAKQCFAAGANQLVSGSYIFTDKNPAAAYQRLVG